MLYKGTFELVTYGRLGRKISFKGLDIEPLSEEIKGYPLSKMTIEVGANNELEAGEKLVEQANWFADLFTLISDETFLITRPLDLGRAEEPPFPLYDSPPWITPKSSLSSVSIPQSIEDLNLYIQKIYEYNKNVYKRIRRCLYFFRRAKIAYFHGNAALSLICYIAALETIATYILSAHKKWKIKLFKLFFKKWRPKHGEKINVLMQLFFSASNVMAPASIPCDELLRNFKKILERAYRVRNNILHEGGYVIEEKHPQIEKITLPKNLFIKISTLDGRTIEAKVGEVGYQRRTTERDRLFVELLPLLNFIVRVILIWFIIIGIFMLSKKICLKSCFLKI